jgi:hypothetical protein
MEDLDFQPVFDYIDKAFKQEFWKNLASKKDVQKLQRSLDDLLRKFDKHA